MPTYEIVLRGDNFLIESEGRKAKCGFYAARTIQGETLEAAERAAVDVIREQLQDRVLNDRADTPVMALAGYNILRSAVDGEASGTAFTFFRPVPHSGGPMPQPRTPLWWRWFGKS